MHNANYLVWQQADRMHDPCVLTIEQGLPPILAKRLLIYLSIFIRL